MQKITFEAFDTQLEFLFAADTCAAIEIEGMLKQKCKHYENLFSRTISTSDVGRLNEAQGEWTSISRETYGLIQQALFYCEKTSGLFDISIAPLVELWNFKNKQVPCIKAVQKALELVSWKNIELPQENNSDTKFFVRLANPDAAIDLGGIAKGYIADALGKALQKYGIKNYLINLGGNILCSGVREDGKPWVVGIKNPGQYFAKNTLDNSKKVILQSLHVHNASIVTSGIYERYFEKDGQIYHHIIDPRTGNPAQTDVASVTVCAKRSIDAEGFSTPFLIMGSKMGVAFAKNQPEIMAAYFYDVKGNLLAKIVK